MSFLRMEIDRFDRPCRLRDLASGLDVMLQSRTRLAVPQKLLDLHNVMRFFLQVGSDGRAKLRFCNVGQSYLLAYALPHAPHGGARFRLCSPCDVVFRASGDQIRLDRLHEAYIRFALPGLGLADNRLVSLGIDDGLANVDDVVLPDQRLSIADRALPRAAWREAPA